MVLQAAKNSSKRTCTGKAEAIKAKLAKLAEDKKKQEEEEKELIEQLRRCEGKSSTIPSFNSVLSTNNLV